ncbi:gamma-glutamyl hydrolase A-like [Aphomia sociella]
MVLLTMKLGVILTVAYFFNCEGAVIVSSEERPLINDRPIIGVLSQEQSYRLKDKYRQQNYTSYIAASYVKAVEASGARVVPILIGKKPDYYRELMSKINGVLFPGGATYFNQSDGYADAGQFIYEIAQELNDAGDYFPIFGTCLGFELLIILASGRGEVENRIKCESYTNRSLNFTNDFHGSKMFKNAPQDIIDLLANSNLTANFHQFCIIDENLKSHNLVKDWRVSSHSTDDKGVVFIATIENKRYPFYGVQFHPEKISFEWKLKKDIPHSFDAVKANRYFMDFFVQECRKSIHAFQNEDEENSYLIYNYQPEFTGKKSGIFQQCYFFEPRCSLSNNESTSNQEQVQLTKA